MAEVFLAHDASVAGVERMVVVKRVLPNLAQDDQFIQMFLNEARIATRLNHPNVAHVYEVGQHEGTYYIAMEFIHGADLGAVLRKADTARLSPSLVALIGARVASALHHAHNCTDLCGKPLHVVHRDVSPQNIRISHEGIVKVLDFGIAKARSNVDTTQSGVLKGKYPYMSPEQISGEELDARSDLFSLGIVLHEMLTYRRLFKRANTLETIKDILEWEIPAPPSSAEMEVPEHLGRIVMKALKRDREARYSSAREMQQALEAALHEQPASDVDLEAFMTRIFGDAAEARRRLEVAVQADALSTVFERTPSRSLTASPTTMGSAAAEMARTARQRPRWPVWTGVALAVGIAAGLSVAISLRDPPARTPLTPTPASTTATLIVKSTPAGAAVWIDGRDVGRTTPTVLSRLPAGRARIALKLSGYQDHQITVAIEPNGVHETHGTLVPAQPQQVVSAPRSIDIVSSARPPHRTTIPRERQPRSKALRPPRTSGPRPKAPPKTPRPKARRPAEVVPPSPRPAGHGWLTLNATPWALVLVDGKRVGVTPIFRLKLTAGPHRVELRNPDRKVSRQITVEVQAGRVVKRVESL